MSRYFTYSSLIHITVILSFIFLSAPVKKKQYYTIDFMGGVSASVSRPEVQKVEPQAKAEKVVTINPKEDLLVKSKKKNKKEKVREVISDVPSVPGVPAPKEESS